MTAMLDGLVPEVDEAAPPPRQKRKVVDLLLDQLLEAGGSDLHLKVGAPARMRVDGELVELPVRTGLLNCAFMEQVVFHGLLDGRERAAAELHEQWELDTSYDLSEISRFRVNIHRERGHWGVVLRTIPVDIPQFDALRLPEVVQTFATYPRGLVLVTGETGSGKSTTLASLIDMINRTRPVHIVTLEDPIEFVHTSKKAIIRHREVGEDVKSFEEGAEARPAPGPRHHPARRDARPGHDPHRHHRRRDRPPGVRHPAHQERPGLHHPHRRRLPRR